MYFLWRPFNIFAVHGQEPKNLWSICVSHNMITSYFYRKIRAFSNWLNNYAQDILFPDIVPTYHKVYKYNIIVYMGPLCLWCAQTQGTKQIFHGVFHCSHSHEEGYITHYFFIVNCANSLAKFATQCCVSSVVECLLDPVKICLLLLVFHKPRFNILMWRPNCCCLIKRQLIKSLISNMLFVK